MTYIAKLNFEIRKSKNEKKTPTNKVSYGYSIK